MQIEELQSEVITELRNLVERCEREDEEVRVRKMAEWRRHLLFWKGVQYLFWNDSEDRWMSVDEAPKVLSSEQLEELGPIYDVVINVFKGHGSAIIAALSTTVPGIRFIPDDADDEADVLTAETYTKISDMLYRHNNVKQLAMQIFFNLYITGNVYSYRYMESDKLYGTYELPRFAQVDTTIEQATCESCGWTDDDYVAGTDSEECPECGAPVSVQPVNTKQVQQVGMEEHPKSRVRITVYNNFNVKVPLTAKSKKELRYLGLYEELPIDTLVEQYPDAVEQILASGMDDDAYDRLEQFDLSNHTDNSDLVTVVKYWLRPSRFYFVQDKEIRAELFQKFPEGCAVTFCGRDRMFLDAVEENLDDRWEIGKAELSAALLADPMGKAALSPCEMRNQTTNLMLATLDHSIPENYADSDIFPAEFSQVESKPGMTNLVKPKGNKSLSDHFYSTPRATMSKDVPGFLDQIDKDIQFVLGSFPSIYGGPGQGNSRTYSEYEASRKMALQRLSIAHTGFLTFWYDTLSGSTKLFASSMMGDEHYTTKNNGSYITKWIRRSEMNGKVGGCEPEGSDQFPITLMQQSDKVTRLMEMQNPTVDSVLYAPENAHVMAKILGMEELSIPGDDQRTKQVLEINRLLREEPISEAEPSLPVDPDVDDHEIHIAILVQYLTQNTFELQRTNPKGDMNCRLHLMQHKMAMQAMEIRNDENGASDADDSGDRLQSEDTDTGSA